MIRWRVEVGDSRERLRELADASVDAVVTDPPYEIGFMGRGWDASGIAYDVGLWREVLRVLKPGGHLLAFGATRTYHRLAVAIEDAGFEIRDSIHWLYGSGFPKSLNVSKALDKAAGAERVVLGDSPFGKRRKTSRRQVDGKRGNYGFGTSAEVTAPATDAARQRSGWGTALKPAHEPIVVARKPLDGTVAANVLAHGTGAINVDECRVKAPDVVSISGASATLGGTREGWDRPWKSDPAAVAARQQRAAEAIEKANTLGRWPPNVVFSHLPACGEECAEGCAVAELDAQSGDTGGASRFFPAFRYQAKPSRRERDANIGIDIRSAAAMRAGVVRKSGGAQHTENVKEAWNNHPTVKPVELMRWCIRLVTPKGGTVLDPFTGSGTTGVAAVLEDARFVGVELSPDYQKIAVARIAGAEASRAGEQIELFDEV